MKLAVLCLVIAISVVYAEEDPYSKFDKVDVDQVLNNDRLLNRYIDCMLEKPNVRCPSEAIEVKKNIQNTLETDCEKCTPNHKQKIRKVIKFIILNKRDKWDQLKAKYDPEGKYVKKYENLAKEEGVTL